MTQHHTDLASRDTGSGAPDGISVSIMYSLNTPSGETVRVDADELQRRIAAGEVLPWDRVSEGGAVFIQARAVPELASAFDDIAVPVGETCYKHADAAPEMSCVQCGRGYCRACAPPPATVGFSIRVCPACGDRLVEQDKRSEETPFYKDIPGALLYPIRGLSFVTTIGIGVLLWLSRGVGPVSFLIYFVALAWVVHAITSAAQGKTSMGFGPDIDDIWTLAGKGLQAFVVTLAVALPFIGLFFALGIDGLPTFMVLAIPLGLVAFVYYPMALAIVTIWSNPKVAFQPHVVFQHIAMIKGEYVILLVANAVLLGARLLLGLPLKAIPVLGPMAGSVLDAYFFLVQGFILGRTMYLNEKELGWD